VGLFPYKIKKKAGIAQVVINWKENDWCATVNLLSDTWYHYSFTMNEESGGTLSCYLNGDPLNTGTLPVTMLAANVILPTEITFGSSTQLKVGAEYPFNGYIKEFRWWKNPRN